MTKKTYHETVQHNPDVGVRFYYSKMDEPGLVPFHWHRSLEIIYVIHGELTFTLNHAMTQISDGQFIVVPSGAIHAVSNTPNEAYVLQIPIDFIKNYWPDPENTTFNLDLTDSDYQKIADYFPVLGDIYDTKIPGYPFIFQATILQMLFALFTTFSAPVTTPETKKDHLKEVLGYINDHYAEQLPISELADMFSYNPNYLSRLFKQEIALSPVQYIYQVRLTHFYQDLLQTDEPVKELLTKNGLTNKRMAMQYFKTEYGTTPLQARKQHSEL